MFRLQTKAQREAARDSFIPKGATVSKITLKDGAAVVYVFSVAGRLYAKAFRGSAAKPEFYHAYKNDEQRRQHVTAWIDGIVARQGRKAVERAKKAAWVNPLKVGDVLYTSWGYDQTNVDFYAVTRVSGRRVHVRPIQGEYIETGFMSGRTKAKTPVVFAGDETVHIAQPSGDSDVYLNIDGHYAHVDKGGDHYCSSYA